MKTVFAATLAALALLACDSAATEEEPAPITDAPDETAQLDGPAAADSAQPAEANEPGSIYDFSVQSITGEEVSLSDYEGQVLLFVNVASECGFTRQYEGLQKLWERYEDQGLVVLGFPANNFGGQEPGTDEEIMAFCENRFGVTFPMFSRISVKGEDQHPLYAYLTERAGEEIAWNFNKILVDRQGQVVSHHLSQVEPLDEDFVAEIEGLL